MRDTDEFPVDYDLQREIHLESLGDLIDWVTSAGSERALSFRVSELREARQLPAEIRELVQSRNPGLLSSIEGGERVEMFFLGVQQGRSVASIQGREPIRGLGQSWSHPRMVSVLSNQFIYTAIPRSGEHSVSVSHFVHNQREFGLPANHGLSVVRAILNLDLPNTGWKGRAYKDGSSLRFQSTMGAFDYQVVRDDDGGIQRICAEHQGVRGSLSQTNNGFLYEIGSSGSAPALRIVCDEVFAIAKPDRLFRKTWAMVVPSTNTYVSFQVGGSNVLYRAGSFDFSGQGNNNPIRAPTSQGHRPIIIRGLLVVVFLMGLAVLGVAWRQQTRRKEHSIP